MPHCSVILLPQSGKASVELEGIEGFRTAAGLTNFHAHSTVTYVESK